MSAADDQPDAAATPDGPEDAAATPDGPDGPDGPDAAAIRPDASPQTRSTEKGLLHYVGLGLSGALLLIVLVLAAVVIVVPRIAGATPLTILTSSMEPSLPPGTLIVVRPVDPVELAVGDVVTYQIRSGEPAVITHRVIAISESTIGERSFQFKGDNNSDPDPDLVVPDQIQGRVWYSVPFIGFANTAMGGDARSWVIPAAAVLLLGYAGFMIASGTAAAVAKRRRG